MIKRNSRHQIVIAAGFMLSSFFLWLSLRQVNLHNLKDALSNINFLPIIFSMGAQMIVITLRSIRWRIITGLPKAEQHSFSCATNIGVLANLLFPGRAGEFIRVLTLGSLLKSSLPVSLGSALIDRLLDIFVLFVCAFTLYFLFPLSSVLGNWLTTFFMMGGIASLLVVLYARSSGIGEVLIARLAKRWELKPELFLNELRSELRRLLGSRLSIELIFLSTLILVADYCVITALFTAFNLSLPIETPLLLWVFLAVGSALPSAPGYIGVYQVAAVWALSFYTVSATTAVAIATVLQITALVVALIMAAPYLFWGYRRFLFLKQSPTVRDVN